MKKQPVEEPFDNSNLLSTALAVSFDDSKYKTNFVLKMTSWQEKKNYDVFTVQMKQQTVPDKSRSNFLVDYLQSSPDRSPLFLL